MVRSTYVVQNNKLLNYFDTMLKYQFYYNDSRRRTNRTTSRFQRNKRRSRRKIKDDQKEDHTIFDMPKATPLSTKNLTTSDGKNNEGIVPESGIITLKEPEVTAEANNTMTQRTIEIATAISLSTMELLLWSHYN